MFVEDRCYFVSYYFEISPFKMAEYHNFPYLEALCLVASTFMQPLFMCILVLEATNSTECDPHGKKTIIVAINQGRTDAFFLL